MRSSDIQEAELICALTIIDPGDLYWIPGIAQADELDSLHYPSRIYIAPWLGEVEAHIDQDPIPADFYDRVLSDDEDVVRRLDGVCITGVGQDPRWRRPNGTLKSNGMTREVAANALAGGLLIDLSRFVTADEAQAEFEEYEEAYGFSGTAFIRDYIVRHDPIADDAA